MISSTEQAHRRRRLNQQIRELIAVRRAVGRPAKADVEPTGEAEPVTSTLSAA